jgi:hypothetical protein
VLTATDGTGCNTASTTFTVVTTTVPSVGPPVASTFFAEGYTGSASATGKSNFKTTYALLNPNVSTVLVTMTYLIEAPGTSPDITPTTTPPNVVVVTHVLPPLADIYVDAGTDIASSPVISGPNIGTHLAPTDDKFAHRPDGGVSEHGCARWSGCAGARCCR